MKVFYHLLCSLAIICCCLLPESSQGQYRIRGTVYDSSRTYPVEAVSVLSTSGRGVATDANGRYEIVVDEKDSIWFSYLNKPTVKFPVLSIQNPAQFDISLMVQIPVLTEVKVQPRNYRLDSLRNRKDYEDVFNWKRPNVESMTSVGPTGAGIDIEELIRVFQFRKNRSMESFRERLLQQERDKFIDHRFSKAVVRRLTGFSDSLLTRFMILYRPSYEFVLYTSDYELQEYIVRMAEEFRRED